VSLLSTVVTFLVWWGLDHILIGWSPLHTPIPGVWSLIAIRARNHLALRGEKILVQLAVALVEHSIAWDEK
jgi:hypothetical protein